MANAAQCLACGEPLVYSEDAKHVVCQRCGKEETGHSICKEGHYICDACHRAEGVALIMGLCAENASVNPINLAQHIMALPAIYANGPEHHTLVGAVLLTCYKNAGGEVELDKALEELKSRSMHVPGGTCGYWGCCGAAISAGQYYSIIAGATPLAEDPWADTARLTSRIMGRLADIGGPRCCKRTGFTAIEEAVLYTAETTGVKMELPEHITCTFMSGNAQCKKRECPYFPK